MNRSIQKIFFGIFAIFLFGGIFSPVLAAGDSDGRLPTGWDTQIKEIGTLQEPVSGNSVEMVRSLILYNFIPLLKYIFIGVSLIILGIYAYYMVLGGTGDEEQLTEQRKNFLFAAIGFFLIGIASQIVEVFDPFETNGEIVNIDNARSVTQVVINYIEIMLAGIAIAVVFYSAIRMITSNGDEEQVSEGKNLFKYAFLGFVIVMLADPLVTAIFFPNDGQTNVGNDEAENFIIQGLGVLKFVLTFLGALVFLSFILAAVFFFTALDDDDRMEKAKRTLIWTAVGLLVIVVSYSLVTFFLGNPL